MAQNELEQLRTSNQVVLVSSQDEGRSWSKISNRIYGFTYTPSNSDGGLFSKQPRQSYEMHKLADGSLWILGFTTAEQAGRLQSTGAQDLEVYPEPRGEYNQLVSIPHSRIASSKPLDRMDFNKLALSLRPVT